MTPWVIRIAAPRYTPSSYSVLWVRKPGRVSVYSRTPRATTVAMMMTAPGERRIAALEGASGRLRVAILSPWLTLTRGDYRLSADGLGIFARYGLRWHRLGRVQYLARRGVAGGRHVAIRYHRARHDARHRGKPPGRHRREQHDRGAQPGEEADLLPRPHRGGGAGRQAGRVGRGPQRRQRVPDGEPGAAGDAQQRAEQREGRAGRPQREQAREDHGRAGQDLQPEAAGAVGPRLVRRVRVMEVRSDKGDKGSPDAEQSQQESAECPVDAPNVQHSGHCDHFPIEMLRRVVFVGMKTRHYPLAAGIFARVSSRTWIRGARCPGPTCCWLIRGWPRPSSGWAARWSRPRSPAPSSVPVTARSCRRTSPTPRWPACPAPPPH